MMESRSEVRIKAGRVSLRGNISLPKLERGPMVIFAHGSGSSRLSPRNSYVADVLHGVGLGTLLFDLLTEEEDQTYENRFNIELLAERLQTATAWVEEKFQGKKLHIGYFGASTGAAAALIASAILGGERISAVVSRGGRPDLAGPYLSKVVVPTLLIVGGNDDQVLELNREALAQMPSKSKQLVVIPGATHLFEETGTLEQVAKSAADWFLKYL
ncbi:MAG TPA: hypothetical protein VFF30_00455 [Nitrososphaerales archaeon]|nr:hypothetical protein [Nitrososphaerales archaeon]